VGEKVSFSVLCSLSLVETLAVGRYLFALSFQYNASGGVQAEGAGGVAAGRRRTVHNIAMAPTGSHALDESSPSADVCSIDSVTCISWAVCATTE